MTTFAPDVTIPEGEAGRRRRLGVLLICSSSLFIVYLDSTILNVALPTLQRDLHASLSGLQWVADAYLLVVSSLLLLSGSAADRLGRKRVFLVGLAGFGLGSLLCSLAPDTGSLIGLRMLQGIGGSMLTPVSLSIVRNTFHDPRERAHAIGIWSGIFGVATACGPIVGGVLVSAIGWRSIFWLNVPICAAMIAATVRYVPESRAPRPRRVDVPGQLLMIAALGSLTYAVIQGPVAGWTAVPVLALFAVAALAAAAFVLVERRTSGAADRAAVLPFPPVHRRLRDRGALVHRARRVPVRLHPVPAGGARRLAADGRAVAAARHAGDGGGRAGRRPAHRPPRPARPAGRQRPVHRGGARAAARPRPGHVLLRGSPSRSPCSAPGSAWSTRPSPTPESPACRPRRRGSPPRSSR